MELYSDNRMYFRLRQINNLSFYYYKNNYDYENITKLLFLLKDHYDDICKVFKFYETALSKNKVILKQSKDNNKILLYLKRVLDFDEVESFLDLEETKLTNEEMIKILFNEMREIKMNGVKKTENKNREENKEIIKK